LLRERKGVLRARKVCFSFDKGVFAFETDLVFTRYEQAALGCLSVREIVDTSRGRTFHCKMAKPRLITVFFKGVGLIYLAI